MNELARYAEAAGVAPGNQSFYENSKLAGSTVEQEYKENPDALFNSKDPNWSILHESPRHRIIIFLKAQALSNRDIARRLDLTEAWVSNILRQPWARQRLVEEIREAGQDAVQGLLASAAEDSVLKIISVRDSATEPAVQLRAADSLLDRYLGKAVQRSEVKAEVTHMAEDIDAVNREIEENERELKRLGVGAV